MGYLFDMLIAERVLNMNLIVMVCISSSSIDDVSSGERTGIDRR